MVVDSATGGKKTDSSGPFCLVAAWDYGKADYAIATGTGSCVKVAQAVCHAEIELSVAVRMQSVGGTGFVVILGS